MPRIKRIIPIGYTTVNNDFLRDTTLSLAARGLLMTMLSLPDGWNMSGKGLAAILPDGRDKVYSTLNILEEKGYLRRERIRENGCFVDVEYQFCDTPIFTPPPKKKKKAASKTKKEKKEAQPLKTAKPLNLSSIPSRKENKETVEAKLRSLRGIELLQYVETTVLDKTKCVADFCVPVDDMDCIITTYIQLLTSTPSLIPKLSLFTSFDIALLGERIQKKKNKEQTIRKFFEEETPTFEE